MPAIEYYGTGKRKKAIARVYLKPGHGAFQVNKRKMEEYFPDEALKIVVKQPLLVTETAEKFDVNVFTLGGGISGLPVGGCGSVPKANPLLAFVASSVRAHAPRDRRN